MAVEVLSKNIFLIEIVHFANYFLGNYCVTTRAVIKSVNNILFYTDRDLFAHCICFVIRYRKFLSLFIIQYFFRESNFIWGANF